MSKRVDQLTGLSDAQVAEDSRLLPIGDPANGQLYKTTMAQLRKAVSLQKEKYIATGAEGDTITVAALADKNIVAILREAGPIYEVATSPDSVEYTWDGVNIVLGTPISYAGERFLILYNNA